jgi:hypothetical protein
MTLLEYLAIPPYNFFSPTKRNRHVVLTRVAGQDYTYLLESGTGLFYLRRLREYPIEETPLYVEKIETEEEPSYSIEMVVVTLL